VRRLLVFFLWLAGGGTFLAQTNAPGDTWITNRVQFPYWLTNAAATPTGFEGLACEAVAGKLKITWPTGNPSTNATVRLFTSFGAPGHWPSLDWHATPMTPRPACYDASLPVVHLDLPVVYFVAAEIPGQPVRFSPMRVCVPRGLGLEQPSRAFWPFLEGFEETLESWRVVSDPRHLPPLAVNPSAINGYSSLEITLPAGQRSATISTTVVRGWHMELFGARGVQFWARTTRGPGELKLALLTHAGSTNQQVFPCPAKIKLTPEWQKLDISFDYLTGPKRYAVDLMTLEFQGEAPCAFLLDEVSLLGRWRLELE
jgi:hypothetical protein